MKTWKNKQTKELFEAILELQNTTEAQNFFRDLLTEQEIIEFANRWKAAKMLSEKIPYTKIIDKTGLSSTTIARISKWLQSGKGGYSLMINRLHHHSPSSLEKV